MTYALDPDSPRSFNPVWEWGGPGSCPLEVQQTGPVPSNRTTSPAQIVYMQGRGSLLMFGGFEYCGGHTYTDTWEYLLDSDADGFGDAVDCDPHSPHTYPGAPQLCDGINNDCSDPQWPDLPANEADADGDGVATCEGDCDDASNVTFPGAPEVCDTLDNDCDGQADEELPRYSYYPDGDGDGFGVSAHLELNCSSTPPPGHVVVGGDCNDADSMTYPAAHEFCDAVDNNCDGAIDNSDECDRNCNPPETVGPQHPIADGADYGGNRFHRTVWNGAGFATVWSDRRLRGTDSVFLALSDSDGRRKGADILVASSNGEAMNPSIAWTGGGYGVAWADTRDGGNLEIYFTLLDATGTKLIPDTRVTTDTAVSVWVDIAWSGDEFGLVWEGQGIEFTTVDPSGERTSAVRPISSNPSSPSFPAIVWTGVGYGAVWIEVLSGHGQVLFQSLAGTGDPIGSPRQVSSVTTNNAWNPRLAWSGSGFGVVWHDGRWGVDRAYIDDSRHAGEPRQR